jgi:hypothetical protein
VRAEWLLCWRQVGVVVVGLIPKCCNILWWGLHQMLRSGRSGQRWSPS